MGKQKKYYVVWKGRKEGIYSTWDDCKAQTDGYKNHEFLSFKTLQQAEEAFKGNYQDYVGSSKPPESELPEEELALIGDPVLESIVVDAACNTVTKEVEYQCVKTDTREKIFHIGPKSGGTNNIGEFLALVHALAHCKKNNLTYPIYSDSQVAIKWVKDKKCNTTTGKEEENEELHQLIERAIFWLENNTYDNKILKWETKAWGENPADFGRK